MSISNEPSQASRGTPLAQPKSGVRAALEYTGIPSSWFSKRLKLPSRNWLIFLTVSSSLTGLYIYDRQQCKKIRRQYIDRVKHLAEEPMDAMDWPRKVTVYGCKWPGDEDYERSMKYFRKYVKPVFVAAALDFEMINGKRHGDLATQIADEIKSRRRLDLGIDKPRRPPMPLPTHKSPQERSRHELEGGIVIIGRHTFKEFMTGLKRGWTDGLEKVDREELLARELEDDGHFEEPDDPLLSPAPEEEPISFSSNNAPLSSPKPSPVYSPLQSIRPPPPPRSSTSRTPQHPPTLPPFMNEPPAIPPLPPLLLVSFTNYVGFKLVPHMIFDFFNERHKVQAGAQAAYRLIKKNTRTIDAPPAASDGWPSPAGTATTDLDFDLKAESYYKKSFFSMPDEIEKARKQYYEALPAKLATARAISRGTRELTKDEKEHPPPTEVELRAERMKKEKRWRGDLEGLEILKPESGVSWDERFADVLQVFIDPLEDEPSF